MADNTPPPNISYMLYYDGDLCEDGIMYLTSESACEAAKLKAKKGFVTTVVKVVPIAIYEPSFQERLILAAGN